jgi:DNA adenine methylase
VFAAFILTFRSPIMTSLEKYVALQLRRHVSPLRYPGGKRSFAPYLTSVIAANGLNGCHYLEPYAGGAGAALELLRTGVVSSITLNDKDPAVYWFWKAALTEGDRFMHQIQSVELNIKEWHRQREILRSRVRGFDLGFAAFYLNRTCVSGVIKRCGGPIGGHSQTGSYLIDCRFHRPALTAKVRFLHENKDSITARNMDALTFIKKYATSKTECLTYLDPPYYHKASELYLNAYTHENHEALRDFLLDEFQDNYWILSYDYCPEILDLYRHHQHSTIHAHHALANKGRKREFITMADKMKSPSPTKFQ